MQGLEDLIVCPITRQVFLHPVILSSKITYEKSAILKWLDDNNICPITKNVISRREKDNLLDNLIVKQIVSELVKGNIIQKSNIFRPEFSFNLLDMFINEDQVFEIDDKNFDKVLEIFSVYRYTTVQFIWIPKISCKISTCKVQRLTDTILENIIISREDFIGEYCHNLIFKLQTINPDLKNPYGEILKKIDITGNLSFDDLPIISKVLGTKVGFQWVTNNLKDSYLKIISELDNNKFKDHIKCLNTNVCQTVKIEPIRFLIENFIEKFSSEIIIDIINMFEKYCFLRYKHIEFLKFLISLNFFEVNIYLRSSLILSLILFTNKEFPIDFSIGIYDCICSELDKEDKYIRDNNIAVMFGLNNFYENYHINSISKIEKYLTDIEEQLDQYIESHTNISYNYCGKEETALDFQDRYRKSTKSKIIKKNKKRDLK